MNTSSVVSLQSIVYNFLNELGIYDMANFRSYLQIAIRGFSNLNMTTVRSFTVEYITVDSKGQALLPDDFIDYRCIGYRSQGRLYSLSLNRNILINRDEINGEIVTEISESNQIPVVGDYIYLPHMNSTGVVVTGMLASGGVVYPSAFNIDYENKIIQLSSMVPSRELVVEYISSGVSLNGNTYVPKKCEDALIEWLHWRTAKSDNKKTRGEKADAKQDYLEAERILLDLETLPTAREVYDVLYLSPNIE